MVIIDPVTHKENGVLCFHGFMRDSKDEMSEVPCREFTDK
jgi:hypothetical protein